MSETILKVENLVIRYGEIRAVKGISFELRRGEILALIGANGAGKTTTLRGLSGMLPYEGAVELRGVHLKAYLPTASCTSAWLMCLKVVEFSGDLP
jgi:branched-chain amino acid transport system ATP-binding protein